MTNESNTSNEQPIIPEEWVEIQDEAPKTAADEYIGDSEEIRNFLSNFEI